MRPDEHKKKKSAQYQRKHAGSSAAKGGKKENDKGASKSGNQQGASRNEASEKNRTFHTDQKTKTELAVSTSDSEDEGEERESQTKSFRRRQIASNWAKYDLPAAADGDDTNTTPRGQDFNKLLQSAGSAMAHFRFKDEENWEDDGANAGGPGAQVLSLDCAELATSLSCLPLYTQLGLNTDIFTTEQLTAMKTTAEENRQAAGLPPLVPEIDDDSPASPPSKSASSASTSALPSDLSINDKTCLPSVSVNKEEEGAVSEQSIDKNRRTVVMTDVAASRKDPSRSAGFTDADLDNLLAGDDYDDHHREEHTVRSAGAEVKVRSSEGQTSSAKGSAVREEVTEQDLDDLLAMDVPQSSQLATTVSAGPKINESKMAAESAELEDWLDSVLDD